MPGVEHGRGGDASDNIWLAAGEGRIEDVERFLRTGGPDGNPLDPNAADQFSYTALHAAASYGHTDIVRLLVGKYGANPNITDSDGDTPMHVVETAETARALVELGADPTQRNEAGRLPIESAYTEGWESVVEFLAEFTPEFEKVSEDSDGEGEGDLGDIDFDEIPPEVRARLVEQLAAFHRGELDDAGDEMAQDDDDNNNDESNNKH
ncbi:hypothetical protein HK105_202721 [Polyrhizophydium stewartii]|uniref:Ankyrin repeat protein n=1 Tax=Polyrhizophydium stewartii TaxID=2732419 RepID=A0ABR4NE90_9FUNG|nr:hypothetical protein HK105_001069 [Polyrhizophydium stewartii]